MKRPEGFDRTRLPEKASAEAPPTPADAAGAEKPPRRRPGVPKRSATPPPSEVRDPAFLATPDTSTAEAKTREREARRRARAAAAERRAVERTEVRRFTRRTRRRRIVWLTAAAVVVALVGAVTISVFSPLLALQTIVVEGTSRIDKKQVVASLDGQLGKPLAMVDFAAVKGELSNFPLIQSYVTETRPPHTLVVKITERHPIASVKVGSTFQLVDPAGVVIATSPTQPDGFPLIDVSGASVDGSVFRAAAEVLLSLPPALRTSVSGVRASTRDDVSLTLATGEDVVWGGPNSSLRKAELLAGLIKDHQTRNPKQAVEYDVSAPDNGIIRAK